jgi:DNA polymerase-3 subunit alpha
MKKTAPFVHLHTHSHYSLLDGLQKVPEMVERTKKLGMNALAITDHGTLSGAIEFYKTAKDNNIKPIIGMEAYVAPRAYTDKSTKLDGNPFHLILLAMDKQGYQNLMYLASIASVDGFYYRPRIDRDLLKKYNHGLIALSGCLSGEVGNALRNNQVQAAENAAKWYKDLFKDRYYLEVQDHEHNWDLQKTVNDQVLKIGQKLDIPVVVTADAHYVSHDDQDAHEVLLCVQTGSQLSDEKRMSLKNLDLFLTDPADIASRWRKHPEVLNNTLKVAGRCNLTLEFGQILIPRFSTPTKTSEELYLEQLAYQGIAWRYGAVSIDNAAKLSKKDIENVVEKDHLKRLNYELSVINKMGFAGYFLIFWDFVNWGKKRGIIFGPGRGSAAGSLVSYSLNITDLDPLKYDLLFERFLNPDRISMPDIDIDIQDDRRDEVIEYVVKKYGADKVAHIVTFGKMAARNAIRDTARVLGVPYADADRLAKMVPPPVQGRHIPLLTSIKQDRELKKEYEQNERSRQVIDLATRLEGTIRSHGVHAAGVVIAPEDIRKYSPLELAQKGVIATQYSMYPVEEIGLLKMDFLGLSNLTVIKNALSIIYRVYKKEIDLPKVSLDDEKTFSLLSRGDTTGVFQLESSGMKRYLKELKPNQFEDIIAMNALYRPGPMAEIPRYIKGKKNPLAIDYPHPSLVPILQSTYGVMVYQEQIISLLQLIAGYSRGQADLVRKAIGKKKRDIMKAEEPKFIEGCLKQGLTINQAQDLWNLIQPFADYSFPKAHAACYALIAYWTAYLKANFPSAFMAALLTSDFENTDRIAIEIAECRKMGIEVLPPDVNESFVEFGVVRETGAIRFGLAAIKNVGISAVEAILKAREAGLFSSLEDFAKRVSPAYVNRKAWESLIKAGALDSLEDRNTLLHNLDKILSYTAKLHKDNLSGQANLFASSGFAANNLAIQLLAAEEALTQQQQLKWERDLLGLFLSANPLDAYLEYLQRHTVAISSINMSMVNKSVVLGGIISNLRKITTKNGMQMAFVEIQDISKSFELIVFPKVYELTKDIWEIDTVIKVKGKINQRDENEELKLLVDEAKIIEIDEQQSGQMIEEGFAGKQASRDDSATSYSKLTIKLRDTADMDLLAQLRELLAQHPGNGEVYVIIGEDQDKLTEIKLPFNVNVNEELRRSLMTIIDADTILIQ